MWELLLEDVLHEIWAGKREKNQVVVFTSICGYKRGLNRTYTWDSLFSETPWYMIQRYKKANNRVHATCINNRLVVLGPQHSISEMHNIMRKTDMGMTVGHHVTECKLSFVINVHTAYFFLTQSVEWIILL